MIQATRSPSGSAKRRFGWKARAMLVVTSGLLAVLVAEIVLRVLRQDLAIPNPILENELFVADHELGYVGHRDRVIRFQYPNPVPHEILITNNKDGFRERREFQSNDPRPRLVILGDSFVWGSGVNEDERFSNRLEEIESAWRVDNLGMGGFGPDLMIRALMKHGLPLKPKVVLYCIWSPDYGRLHPLYLPNGFATPRYEFESGELRSIPYPERSVFGRSHVGMAWYRWKWRSTQAPFPLMGALVEKFAALSREHDFRGVTVFLPVRRSGEADRLRRDHLKEVSMRWGLESFDLSPFLDAAGPEAFIKGDVHFSPAGHRLVADELRRLIGRPDDERNVRPR